MKAVGHNFYATVIFSGHLPNIFRLPKESMPS